MLLDCPLGRMHARRFLATFTKAQPLRSLRRASLSSVRNHEILKGKFIGVTLQADAKSVKEGALVQICDTSYLLVHNVPSGFLRMLSKSAVVAIKEPQVQLPLLVVPSIASLEFFEEECLEAEVHLSETAAQVLMEQGDRFFRQHEHTLAAQEYSRILVGLRQQQSQLYVSAASKRAQCFISLNRYEEAVADCNKALEVNATHEKSLFRKGVALLELQEFKQAEAILTEAEQLAETRDPLLLPKVQSFQRRCSNLLQQSESGRYDLENFLSSGCKFEEAPADCADFVGPVEIRMTADGRGRGLFLTRDVHVGELLLVSNPLAIGSPRSESSEADLVAEAANACSVSSKALAQLSTLAGASQAVPDLFIFKSSTGLLDRMKEKPFCSVDLETITRVLSRSSFTVRVDDTRKVDALWALPAMINHSCLQNVSMLSVGKTCFIHAARELKAGDELVLSYDCPLVPWCLSRWNAYSHWGFECKCPRCELEKKHDKLLRPFFLGSASDIKASNVHDWARQFCNKLEALLEEIGGLSEHEKNWIRAGASTAYTVYACSKLPAPNLPSAGKVIETIHSVAPGYLTANLLLSRIVAANGGGFDTLTQMLRATYGRCLPSNVVLDVVKWLLRDSEMSSKLGLKLRV